MTTPELDMGAMFRIAVPSGRDYDRCLAAFESEYGISVPRFSDRCLRTEANGREYTRVKGKDVPACIDGGYADVGLIGTDVCEEQILDNVQTPNLRYRAIGGPMCTFNLLLPNATAEKLNSRLEDPEAKPVVVATSYPGFLGHCIRRARKNGLPMNIEVSEFQPSGSVEVMPALGISEAVADIVESGNTALANGLALGLELAVVRPAIVWRSPH